MNQSSVSMARAGAYLLLAAVGLLWDWGGARAMAEQRPEDIVREVSNEIMVVLNSSDAESLRRDPETLSGVVNNIILPVFDFEAFSKLSLGRHWREASPEQRRRFTEAFRTMLVGTYTKYLADYGGTTVRILDNRSGGDDRRWRVDSEVVVPNHEPLPVVYSFWRKSGKWKVYNVSVEGLSLVQLFRNSFSDKVNQEGLDALIEQMEAGDPSLVRPEVDGGVSG